MSSAGVELTVRGLVQGVGFRYWCYHTGNSLGLVGCVRNNPDGSVSVFAEGDRSLLEELVKQVRIGPAHAHVTGVDVQWTEYSGQFKRFDISI